MNFYCARCNTPLPYCAGMCPSCGQVFAAHVPAHDAPRYSGAGALSWPVRRPSFADVAAGYLEGAGDLISPPILLTSFAFLLIGILVSAHWLLAQQLRRLEQVRVGARAAPVSPERWPDHTLFFLCALGVVALAVAGYGLARARRMREAGRLSGPAQVRSLLAREGLGALTLLGVLAWFAAGVQAQDRLADRWVAAAHQAALLAVPDPQGADDSDAGTGVPPEARSLVSAEDRLGEAAFRAGAAAVQRLKSQGRPVTLAAVLPALTQMRQAEAALKRAAAASPATRAEATADLSRLEGERRRLIALS